MNKQNIYPQNDWCIQQLPSLQSTTFSQVLSLSGVVGELKKLLSFVFHWVIKAA